ncbi:MAG: TIGR01548 family HAD-type hydrolase, partial [Prochlorococcaceae cyanobacterium ETNP1_MAG_9]|nr:TIGR01548 family HAD-type hydrolase [Prochlorococcaceae cyanobacterium ETNP1_MAG_9]
DPTGLLSMATKLAGVPLGKGVPPITYLGDTVADVLTIQQARKKVPNQIFTSLAVAPPHLHNQQDLEMRTKYESLLKKAGADRIVKNTEEVLTFLDKLESSK